MTEKIARRLKIKASVRGKISGTATKPRMSVFKSNSQIYVQIIDDHSGTTLVSASTIDSGLRSAVSGKNKTEQARVVGEEVARRALEKDIKAVIFDRGGFYYTGRVKALAEGARKGGLEF